MSENKLQLAPMPALWTMESVLVPQSPNTALLEVVADYVERHPEEFDMDFWKSSDRTRLERFKGWLKGHCGTVGCVAFHAVRLGGGDIAGNVAAQAQRLLGLTDEQAINLFYSESWPEPYGDEFESLGDGDLSGRAWLAAQRIRHMALTGE
jgi:hypothetical protein